MKTPLVKKLDKSEKIDLFCVHIVRHLAFKGEEGISATMIARAMGVSRAWIYKYVGSDPKKWIRLAAEQVGHSLAELNTHSPSVATREEALSNWLQGSKNLLNDFEQSPWLGSLYFRFLGQENHPIGEAINKIATQYNRQVQKTIEKLWSQTPANSKAIAFAFTEKKMVMAHAWARGVPAGQKISKEHWASLMLPDLAK